MTNEDLQKLNREVAEWLGTSIKADKFDYFQQRTFQATGYPDYILDPVDLLREIMKREDWYEFAKYLRLCGLCHILEPSVTWHSPTIYIHPSLVTEAGLLLLKVGEWMEEQEMTDEKAIRDFYNPANDNMTVEEFKRLHPKKLTNQEKSRYVAEKCGIPWDTHEGWYGNFSKNPNYALDVINLLEVLIAQGIWVEIYRDLPWSTIAEDYLIDKTGKLLDAAVKFLEDKCS